MNGLITKILQWATHPYYAEDLDTFDWAGGLVLILMLSFLWATVVRRIE